MTTGSCGIGCVIEESVCGSPAMESSPASTSVVTDGCRTHLRLARRVPEPSRAGGQVRYRIPRQRGWPVQ